MAIPRTAVRAIAIMRWTRSSFRTEWTAQPIVMADMAMVAMFMPPGTSWIAPSGYHWVPQARASARMEK